MFNVAKSKDTKSFEEQLERLAAIVDDLEQGDLDLEEGVSLYKEGLAISKACAAQLEAAKNEIELVGGGELPGPEGS